MNMTAKESKAVAWQWRVHGDMEWQLVSREPAVAGQGSYETRTLIPESALHAAEAELQTVLVNGVVWMDIARDREAELGELRRKGMELVESIAAQKALFSHQDSQSEAVNVYWPDHIDPLITELRQLLASDGGADGDNEGEGK